MNVVDFTHPLGQKINVIGGGGKTTLAKALSAKYSYKNVELDYLHFLPNWVEREPEDFRKIVAVERSAGRLAAGGWRLAAGGGRRGRCAPPEMVAKRM